MKFICIDGKFVSGDEPQLYVSNRSFRYGEGFFETMRLQNGIVNLETLHRERIQHSLQLLQLELPALASFNRIFQEVKNLCEKNKCSNLARIRLSFFGGNGGINEMATHCNYVIECWELANQDALNINGLVIGCFGDIKKSCDLFSGLKTASFLPYVMAAKYAKAQHWNDCLVLNCYSRIADASIANIFAVRDTQIITPALTEGCVDGVMRRYLLNNISLTSSTILESTLSVEEVLNADEIFLTNAISGIRWVSTFGEKKYGNRVSSQLYSRFISPMFKNPLL